MGFDFAGSITAGQSADNDAYYQARSSGSQIGVIIVSDPIMAVWWLIEPPATVIIDPIPVITAEACTDSVMGPIVRAIIVRCVNHAAVRIPGIAWPVIVVPVIPRRRVAIMIAVIAAIGIVSRIPIVMVVPTVIAAIMSTIPAAITAIVVTIPAMIVPAIIVTTPVIAIATVIAVPTTISIAIIHISQLSCAKALSIGLNIARLFRAKALSRGRSGKSGDQTAR